MGTAIGDALDLESRVHDDHHQALKLWLRLLACTTLIETEIRARFRAGFGTTLPRFDLMAQLEREPGGLKMSELSQRLMVTGGNVTGLTDQLEGRGWSSASRSGRPARVRGEAHDGGAAAVRPHGRDARALGHRAVRGARIGREGAALSLLGRLKAHTQQIADDNEKGRRGDE